MILSLSHCFHGLPFTFLTTVLLSNESYIKLQEKNSYAFYINTFGIIKNFNCVLTTAHNFYIKNNFFTDAEGASKFKEKYALILLIFCIKMCKHFSWNIYEDIIFLPSLKVLFFKKYFYKIKLIIFYNFDYLNASPNLDVVKYTTQLHYIQVEYKSILKIREA